MHSSLKTKIVLWFVIIALVLGTAALMGYRRIYDQIHAQAEAQMGAKLAHVIDVLVATDQICMDLVRSSMRVLKLEAQRLGEPSLRTVREPDGKTREELFFGDHAMSGSFELVDKVKALMGGTATIFIKDGDRFIRITTNVERPEGGRAVGTQLDPNGKAIAKIRQGEAFYGVVDILGKPYLTGYEPIFDASGRIIGVYYVGYALETLKVVHQALEEQRILDEGFFALLDARDRVVFPDERSPLYAKAEELVSGQDTKNWKVERRTFQPWDYEVMGALYLPDIREVTFQMIWQAGLLVGGVIIAVMVVSFILASKLSDAIERAEVATHAAIEARDAAESANRTKSTFLANMSHELRTPMNAIIGYSEMLIEEAEDLDQNEFIPDLQKIRNAGKHLLALINDILDLSKIEAGKMTIYLETFDLQTMIREVVETIQPLLEKNSNRLELNIAPDIGSMKADLTKVRQTLFNLLSNASKFTEKGTITLSASRIAREAGEFICFRVADTGIGMSKEQLGKLFQAFTQADASTTRKYGGTGLGLVISRKFCQMMGGDISVESTEGVGTTFTFELPVEVQEPSEPSVTTTQTTTGTMTTPRAGKTVLVIDDDPDANDLMARALEKSGFATLRAHRGGDGLELARKKKPDAITLDVMMPGMDGWSVLSVLKSDPETASIPVVMVTMLQDRQLGFALGASDFLTKPVDADKLRNVITSRIGKPKANVLVVDDEPNNRDMLSRLLEREGLIVTTAENGSVALEKLAAQERPDLILLDLMMPVMDGFEFLRVLRGEPQLADIPVVVITAKDLTAEDRRILDGSVQDIIAKGAIDREKLLREVVTMVKEFNQGT